MGLLSLLVLLGPAGSLRAEGDAAGLLRRGLAAFGRGDFEAAAVHFKAAATLYGEAKDPAGRVDALIHLGAAYHSLGHYKLLLGCRVPERAGILDEALELAERLGDRRRLVAVLSSLGNACIFSWRAAEARGHLVRALALAGETGDREAEAILLNNLGNLLAARGEFPDARDLYGQCVDLARSLPDRLLVSRALVNAAFSEARAGEEESARELNREARESLSSLPDSHDRAYLLITTAEIDRHILTGHPDPAARRQLLEAARGACEEATRVARRIGDRRAESWALGIQGGLLEISGDLPGALRLTRNAVFVAQQLRIPEALYRWQWRTARILAARGERDMAIRVYRRAVETLQSIRHDVAVAHGNRTLRSSFREAAGSIFYELADLHLRRAASVESEKARQADLGAARDSVEQLKSAELDDYFQDDCFNLAGRQRKAVERVDPRTAVVYIIPLEDRTELLVGLAGGLRQFRSPVGAEELNATVRLFRRRLEDRLSHRYLRPARRLHEWLIRPIASALEAARVDTLVFVPDGALRSVPMAALHDGQEFLLARYAIAVTPGLTLMEPRPVPRKRIQLLINGLSEPVQGYAPLRFVPVELEELERVFRGKKLENRSFLAARFREEVTENLYTIVHIASHAEFSRDASESFLLAYDRKLGLDDLENSIKPNLFRDRPVELLTLSACQTAVGDDRAALGLAGIAIKSGARSALATLWFVNDRASSLLITEFYRQLRGQPDLSKAGALRRAQLKILGDRRHRHPCYWAPYLIIGNWL